MEGDFLCGRQSLGTQTDISKIVGGIGETGVVHVQNEGHEGEEVALELFRVVGSDPSQHTLVVLVVVEMEVTKKCVS